MSNKYLEKISAFNTGPNAPGMTWKATGKKEAPGKRWKEPARDPNYKPTPKKSAPKPKVSKGKGKLGLVAGGLAAAGAALASKSNKDHEKAAMNKYLEKIAKRTETKVYKMKGKPEMPKSVTGKTGLPATVKKVNGTTGRWRAAALAGGALAAAAIASARKKQSSNKGK